MRKKIVAFPLSFPLRFHFIRFSLTYYARKNSERNKNKTQSTEDSSWGVVEHRGEKRGGNKRGGYAERTTFHEGIEHFVKYYDSL